jgi:hypothetical protein
MTTAPDRNSVTDDERDAMFRTVVDELAEQRRRDRGGESGTFADRVLNRSQLAVVTAEAERRLAEAEHRGAEWPSQPLDADPFAGEVR